MTNVGLKPLNVIDIITERINQQESLEILDEKKKDLKNKSIRSGSKVKEVGIYYLDIPGTSWRYMMQRQ